MKATNAQALNKKADMLARVAKLNEAIKRENAAIWQAAKAGK